MSLLDCAGVAAAGDASEHGHYAGDPGQLVAALTGLGEEAEHLSGAGGAGGGEVGERGRRPRAHGAAPVFRQLAELVQRRGHLAALPCAASAAADEADQRRDGRRVRPDGALVDVHRGEAGERRGGHRRGRAAGRHRGGERVDGAVRHEPDACIIAVEAEVQHRPGGRLILARRVPQQHRHVAGLQHIPPHLRARFRQSKKAPPRRRTSAHPSSPQGQISPI
ncbi:hypothetical protein E2562_032500 [Oryza meyeriana var. granulata]|uniref:Uncharacterized protein n=1 Tax=Oryza meyeriana var. granulata TaxID=110450 RepID=A0A6G1E5L3_9ORYZ|nr:hypothetical protein E2562_032500 [Oryza meyeriana var. granulata]